MKICFIGNVGDSKALAEVVKSWARPLRLSSTKELLSVMSIKIIYKDFIGCYSLCSVFDLMDFCNLCA